MRQRSLMTSKALEVDQRQRSMTLYYANKLEQDSAKDSFDTAASTNDIAGQLLGNKKPLKTSCFQGLCLVAGARFELATFRL
jgi:hypothetical protein